jgi:NADH dehydrogenase
MATVGKNRAVVEIGKSKLGGFMAWAIWMFVHLMSLVGFRNRFVIFVNWTKNYFSSDRGMRLIIREFNMQEAKKKRKREMEEEQGTKLSAKS